MGRPSSKFDIDTEPPFKEIIGQNCCIDVILDTAFDSFAWLAKSYAKKRKDIFKINNTVYVTRDEKLF